MRIILLGMLMILSGSVVAAEGNAALQGCIDAMAERYGVKSEGKPFSERKSGTNFDYRLNGVDADGEKQKSRCKVNKRGAVLKLQVRAGHWS